VLRRIESGVEDAVTGDGIFLQETGGVHMGEIGVAKVVDIRRGEEHF
jgi:hypothetical protein